MSYTEQIIVVPNTGCVRQLVGIGPQGDDGIAGTDAFYSNNVSVFSGPDGLDGPDVTGEPGFNGENQLQPFNNFNGQNGQNSQNSQNGAQGAKGLGAAVKDYGIFNVVGGVFTLASGFNVSASGLGFTPTTSGGYRITCTYQPFAGASTLTVGAKTRSITMPAGQYSITEPFVMQLVGGVHVPVLIPTGAGKVSVLAL